MQARVKIKIANTCRFMAEKGLAEFNLGLVSYFERKAGVIVIPAAGTLLEAASPEEMLIVLPDGQIIEGEGTLPRDFAIHAAIYSALPSVCAIASGYPDYATVFAQAGRPIKPYGTLHAELFGDAIPVTRKLTPSEIAGELPVNMGKLLAETITAEPNLLGEVGAVLLNGGGLWCFGHTPEESVICMAKAERLAKLALSTELLQKSGASGGTRMQEDLLWKIYENHNF